MRFLFRQAPSAIGPAQSAFDVVISLWPDPTDCHTYQLVNVVLEVRGVPHRSQKPRVAIGEERYDRGDLLSIRTPLGLPAQGRRMARRSPSCTCHNDNSRCGVGRRGTHTDMFRIGTRRSMLSFRSCLANCSRSFFCSLNVRRVAEYASRDGTSFSQGGFRRKATSAP